MKKLLTMTLVGTMLLLAACGGGGTGGSSDSGGTAGGSSDFGQSGDFISIEKSVFSRGETITVTTTGITEEMEDAGAFVAIYNAGAAHSEYKQYLYPQAGSDALHFTAPSTAGNYEMRLYKQDYVYTDETFVESLAFTVESEAAAGNTPSGGGASGQLSGAYSWIDDEDDNKITYTFSGNTVHFSLVVDGEVVLEAPGTYEIRGNMMIITGEGGDEGEGEFKLEGNTLTLYRAWFNEDLILTKE